MRKMDVPDPIYDWLLTIKMKLMAERKRGVTFAEVWEYVKAQQEGRADDELTAEAERVEAAIMADRARRAGR